MSKFSILPYTSMLVEMAGVGHESLSILFRFAYNLLSVLDPASHRSQAHIAAAFNPRRKQNYLLSPSPQTKKPRLRVEFCNCGDGGS